MARFVKRKSVGATLRALLLPIGLFILLFYLLMQGVSMISKTASGEGLKAARQAVVRISVQCYALEGVYPPSLAYMREHYGLAVDTEKYIVDYVCIASNLMPDITVLERGKGGAANG